MSKYLLLFNGWHNPYREGAPYPSISCTRIVKVYSDDELPEKIEKITEEVNESEPKCQYGYVLHQILKL